MDKNIQKLCIVGLGKVGYPLFSVLNKWHSVRGFDRDQNRNYDKLTLRAAVQGADAVIIIVPTPSKPDGSFSNEHVFQALCDIKNEAIYHGNTNLLYVIGSTVVPGSCEQFKEFVGPNVVYNPLFIRLEHVYEDLKKPWAVLIGADTSELAARCAAIWDEHVEAPIVSMSLIEAELAKITLNCALTMKISLANQTHLVAQKVGADSRKIMQFVGLDPRIGPHYLEPGRPYGGPCLPRDNRMFSWFAQGVGVNAALSWGTDKVNEDITDAVCGKTQLSERPES